MLTIMHTEASPGWAGQEIRLLTEAQAFAKRGFRVVVVGQPGAPLTRQAAQRGLPVHALRMSRPFDPVACWRLRRLMQAERVDLVHTHSSIDAWLAGFAAKSLGLPVVRSRHVAIPVKRRRNFVYNALSDRIIASGAAIRDLLMAGGVPAAKIVSVAAGVDLARFHTGVSGAAVRRELALQGPVIGTVARFAASKGYDVLLQAVPEILAQEPAAAFLWVGDGPSRHVVQRHIAQAGLAATIRLPGFRDDVPELLAAMDVFVLPSVKDGVPQVILQALAMRKPVVASAVGGIAEVIQHRRTGVLVPPRDPPALAAAVLQVLRQREQAAAWAEAGRQQVERHYRLEDMIDRTAAVYTAVLVERGWR
jgi:glycosyltransferase involved in cell wall biosynthesis